MAFKSNRLYRYRCCTDYAIDNLKNSLLWLSAPGDFNDPFDCGLSVLKMTFVEKSFAGKVTKIFSNPEWNSHLTEPEKEAIKASPNPLSELGRIVFVRSGAPRLTDWMKGSKEFRWQHRSGIISDAEPLVVVSIVTPHQDRV
jgi:hypothetical protein